MSGHGIDACACGAVVSQCRCMEGHHARRVVCQTCRVCAPSHEERIQESYAVQRLAESMRGVCLTPEES